MDIIDSLKLKIDLLINGVSLNGDFDLNSRVFLSSISDGIHLIIFGDIYVTTSINKESPFVLKSNADKSIFLELPDVSTMQVEIVSSGRHFEVKSSDGTLMENIGTFQTDRLRVSAYKGCNFVIKNEECKFCEASYKRIQIKNKLENISELISYSEKFEDRIKHYLVSGGTPPDNGWTHFINVCKTIRNNTNKPIYAMFSPPPNLYTIREIIDVGVQDIAINIELFNRSQSEKIIRGKTRLGIEKYFESLEYAVELLGKTGNVKSVLIVGLESYTDTLNGVENLAKRGIMPILSIFKPVKGTPLENLSFPKRDDLVKVWEDAQNICEDYSLTLGPLCKCCQNNTLTIPINNKYFKYE